jgi:hypothetical protein
LIDSIEELDQFLDLSRGGGMHLFHTAPWKWLNQLADKDFFKTDNEFYKTGTVEERRLSINKKEDLERKIKKTFKGTLYPDFDKLFSTDRREVQKTIACIKAQFLKGTRNWEEDIDTPHAIAIVYDANGIGKIVDSCSNVIGTIDTIPKPTKGEDLIRLKGNIVNFYSHIAFVQNVFKVDVELKLQDIAVESSVLKVSKDGRIVLI